MTARPMLVGTTYWPSAVGPHLWHEYQPGQVRSDLGLLRSQGFVVARVILSWDVFMASERQVNGRRLADLEDLLNAATAAALQIVPVVFAASLGGWVMLPPYAVDRGSRRPGVRVLCDGVVQAGGPRDIYADQLMLETEVRYLDSLLGAFSNHPAIAAWDLGHDPAATIRPLRIGHLEAWTKLMSGRIRERGDRCWLTLGIGDVLTARGVRPGAVASHVDALGLAVPAAAVRRGGGQPAAADALFLSQLSQRLCGSGAARLLLQPTMPTAAGGVGGAEGEVTVPDGPAIGYVEQLTDGLAPAGLAGVLPWPWADTGERTAGVPPFDRDPSLRWSGLVDAGGSLKPVGSSWCNWAGREHDVGTPAPWPGAIDVEGYYRNLPDSVDDLHSMWLRDRGGERHGEPGGLRRLAP